MPMPNITITFKTLGATAIKRSEKGTVAMILSEAAPALQGEHILTNVTQVPALSAANKEQVSLAFMGYSLPPRKVILYVIGAEGNDLAKALEYFATQQFDYLVGAPEFTAEEVETIASWVKSRRSEKHTAKAVLPNLAADTEGVINFATADITTGAKTFTTAEYCARMAGLIAGTPMAMSATYAPLSEVTNVTRLTKEQMDTAVDDGKLILFHNGKEVLTGRAVNSLTTTTQDKGEAYRKIKILEVMDMLQNDIRMTAQNSYIGKYANSYDNKCLLVTAIQGYLEGLEVSGILQKGASVVEIDVAAQENYLKSKGNDTSEMSEQEIKEANTGSEVFIRMTVKILDAIEDITIAVSI